MHSVSLTQCVLIRELLLSTVWDRTCANSRPADPVKTLTNLRFPLLISLFMFLGIVVYYPDLHITCQKPSLG